MYVVIYLNYKKCVVLKRFFKDFGIVYSLEKFGFNYSSKERTNYCP